MLASAATRKKRRKRLSELMCVVCEPLIAPHSVERILNRHSAVGSDTGGSVWGSAAVGGGSALRPTVGATPMSGSKTQLSPAIDTSGPMARSAEDLADF